MKVGVFSDVHGHFDELHKTLRLFELLQVDQVVCAGDLVDKGLCSDEVIATIRDLNIPCVKGNHDAKAQHRWLSDKVNLRETSIAYLKTLPDSLNFEWIGVSVYLCHSTPWHDYSVYVYPTRPPVLFELVATAVEAQIIILGHTHHPMRIESAGKLLVNPGSIYGNRDRRERTCGVLSLPDGDFQLYDIDSGRALSF
jgi:putative phosphoesterase